MAEVLTTLFSGSSLFPRFGDELMGSLSNSDGDANENVT